MTQFEYKITKRNEWRHLRFIIEGVIIFAVSIPFMIYVRGVGIDELNIVITIALLLMLVYEIPALILYLKYYSLDEGKVMLYEPNELKITISDKKKGEVSEFTLDDIKGIFHTMTGSMESGGLHLTSWSKFNYSEIYLSNGKKHIITSLMVDKLELPIGDKYEVITSFYPYPKG